MLSQAMPIVFFHNCIRVSRIVVLILRFLRALFSIAFIGTININRSRLEFNDDVYKQNICTSTYVIMHHMYKMYNLRIEWNFIRGYWIIFYSIVIGGIENHSTHLNSKSLKYTEEFPSETQYKNFKKSDSEPSWGRS